jgi:hypothetical protein
MPCPLGNNPDWQLMAGVSASETILNKEFLVFQMTQHVRVKKFETFRLERSINISPPDM